MSSPDRGPAWRYTFAMWILFGVFVVLGLAAIAVGGWVLALCAAFFFGWSP